jgi:hypothetical protein
MELPNPSPVELDDVNVDMVDDDGVVARGFVVTIIPLLPPPPPPNDPGILNPAVRLDKLLRGCKDDDDDDGSERTWIPESQRHEFKNDTHPHEVFCKIKQSYKYLHKIDHKLL